MPHQTVRKCQQPVCGRSCPLVSFFIPIFHQPRTNEMMEALKGFVCAHACVPVACHVEQDADKFAPEIRYF